MQTIKSKTSSHTEKSSTKSNTTAGKESSMADVVNAHQRTFDQIRRSFPEEGIGSYSTLDVWEKTPRYHDACLSGGKYGSRTWEVFDILNNFEDKYRAADNHRR